MNAGKHGWSCFKKTGKLSLYPGMMWLQKVIFCSHRRQRSDVRDQ